MKDERYCNPYPQGSAEALAWKQGASAALTAVQVVGEHGGEYIDNLVMEAEVVIGLQESFEEGDEDDG